LGTKVQLSAVILLLLYRNNSPTNDFVNTVTYGGLDGLGIPDGLSTNLKGLRKIQSEQ
jgi:hypothetical protein